MRNGLRMMVGSIAMVIVTATATTARAEQPAKDVRLFATGIMAPVGNVSLKSSADSGSVEGDLDTAWGFNAGLEYVLRENFVIGARTGLSFWTGENDSKKFKTWDTSLVPGLRLPFENAEITAMIPIGISLNFVPDVESEMDLPGVVDVSIDPKLGGHLGMAIGGKVWVNSSVALVVEAGWYHHWLRNKVSATDGIFSDSTIVKFDLDQFVMNLGIMAAL